MENSSLLGAKIRALNFAIKQNMDERIASLDLTTSQSYVLRYLSQNRSAVLYPKDVEKRFQLTHPTVSGILQRLEAKGFIRVEPDPDDRRCRRILLTEKADLLQHELCAYIQSLEQTMTCGMTEKETETLLRLLDLAAQNLNRSKQKEELAT